MNELGVMAMAASTTGALSISAQVAPGAHFAGFDAGSIRCNRRRHIDPASGRALEILGHAIEYLTDELVHSGVLISANDPQVEAVQLLMALNRQVYFECPAVRTFGDRRRSFLRLRSV
jgi:hypothetical protein